MSASGFTLEKLMAAKRLVDAMPPAPVFATWEHFPRDHAVKFNEGGRDYVGAHPDFWSKIPASERGTYQSLSAIKIIDLSLPFYAKEKAVFLAAMLRVTKAILADGDSPSPPPVV